MKINTLILSLFFALFTLQAAYSQELIESPVNSNIWLVPAEQTRYVSSNLTIQYLKIEDGGTLIVKAGAKLIIQNDIIDDIIPNHQNTIDIFGEISVVDAITFPVSTNLTVRTGGNFNSGIATFKGNNVTILNEANNNALLLDANISVGGLVFTNNSSINTIENKSNFAANSVDAQGTSTLYFKNNKNISITGPYNNNVNSVYVNCYDPNAIISLGALNLNGGKAYNAGTINFSGAIVFGTETALLENYGTINGQGIELGGGSSYIYNSGNMNLNGNITNDGHLKGPISGSNYGRISFNGTPTMINGSVTGNLNITNAGNTSSAAIFSSNINIGSAVIFGYCQLCAIVTTGGECRNPNGSLPPCTQVGATGTPDSYTRVVISNLETNYLNLTESSSVGVPNGFLALESHTKGLVITRVADATAIADPKKGMLIYDIAAACVKLYNGTFWNCIEQTCNN